MIDVFRAASGPDVIVKGTKGTSLTIDLSFGDEPVEEWIAGLSAPYPLLMIDPAWAERFPDSAQLIKEKNIPISLLGEPGASYEEDPALFNRQLEHFTGIFEKKPLWFRTQDEYFPKVLRDVLWEKEINALGSSTRWRGGVLPKVKEGDIIAVSLDRRQLVSLDEVNELLASRQFQSVEDVLFTVDIKTKKIPE
ncbi:hypothetical protein [Sporosarcina koreensis]|uniref:hypothetical protein n=1 Tax=Sporosarcina koreensis TaxID=334735 RepID=UPI000694E3D2|nr:hypothetical protein [Sporosarcina koreensis]